MDVLHILARQFLLLYLGTLVLLVSAGAYESKRGSGTKFTVYRTTKRGGYLSKTLESIGDECTKVPKGWNEIYQRVSVTVLLNCASLYESPNCEGPHTDVSNRTSTFKEKIKRVGIVNSFSECSSNSLEDQFADRSIFGRKRKQSTQSWRQQRQQKPPKTVTFYTGTRFRGQRHIAELKVYCQNIPENFQNEVSSIQTPEDCVRIYTNVDCQGRSIQIQAFDRYKDDLTWLDFNNRVHSFGPCQGFQQHGLDMHNYYRELHDTPPLEMEESLNQSAQLMADYLATQPALPKPIGFISSELFYSANNATQDRNLLVEQAINSWYREGESYNSSHPVNSRFTQLVWRNTRKFGMGTARASDGSRAIVVANYFPRGNFPGQFAQNVLPLKLQ